MLPDPPGILLLVVVALTLAAEVYGVKALGYLPCDEVAADDEDGETNQQFNEEEGHFAILRFGEALCLPYVLRIARLTPEVNLFLFTRCARGSFVQHDPAGWSWLCRNRAVHNQDEPYCGQ